MGAAIYVIGFPLYALLMVRLHQKHIRFLAIEVDKYTQSPRLQAKYTYEEYKTHKDLMNSKNDTARFEFQLAAVKFQKDFGSLIAGYEVKWAHWEFVISIRKILIVMIAMALRRYPSAQIMMAILVIFLFSIAHLQCT